VLLTQRPRLRHLALCALKHQRTLSASLYGRASATIVPIFFLLLAMLSHHRNHRSRSCHDGLEVMEAFAHNTTHFVTGDGHALFENFEFGSGQGTLGGILSKNRDFARVAHLNFHTLDLLLHLLNAPAALANAQTHQMTRQTELQLDTFALLDLGFLYTLFEALVAFFTANDFGQVAEIQLALGLDTLARFNGTERQQERQTTGLMVQLQKQHARGLGQRGEVGRLG